jgi:branched-chain amino acid transport system substrate-binding protein
MASTPKHSALALTAASLLLLVTAACAPAGQAPATEPAAPPVTEAATGPTTAPATEPATNGVTVGALLPLTGSLASYGETSRAALDDAVAALGDANFNLAVEDTKTDPPTALERLQALKERGVKVVIGPFASSEVAAVKQYAEDNGIVLVSPLSTASRLALPGDTLLRFTPDDELEGAAAAALAYADGLRVIVPVSRDDEGNLGLQAAFKPAFEKLGGRVVGGVTYAADETDFQDEVQAIAAALEQAGADGPAGVYLTAFNEVRGLLGAAADAKSDVLAKSAWYGSDSVAQSAELVADAKAAAFAATVGYPNPILGLRDADKAVWGPVSERLTQQLGRSPDAFALAAYDALDVVHQALAEPGAADDATALAGAIVRVADSYTGLTGPTELDAAGDRALGNYDFWSVCHSGTTWTWYRSAAYTVGADGKGEIAHFEPTNCERPSP